MPTLETNLHTAMPSGAADKKVQEGLLRLMMQHEMLILKNDITDRRIKTLKANLSKKDGEAL
jgi:hypothetical protein